MILLFIGPSGSGKDTQADILDDKYDFVTVSTGDLIREAIKNKTDLGMMAVEYYDNGEWVPDDIVYKLLENKIRTLKGRNIILTGAIRTEKQIPMLDELLERIGDPLDYVIFFDLDDRASVKRLANRWYAKDGTIYHTIYRPPKVAGKHDKDGSDLFQREDDKPQAITQRLEEFHRTTKPILEEYDRRGLLIRIDASPPIKDVACTLESKIELSDCKKTD